MLDDEDFACAHAAFDPARDDPGTFYGFTREEWEVAAAHSGGTTAFVATHWQSVQDALRAGDGLGIDLAALLGLAQLGPAYARRVVNRLEPAFSRDWALLERVAASPGSAAEEDLLHQLHPAPDAPGVREELRPLLTQLLDELPVIRELARLADLPGPEPSRPNERPV